MSRTARASAALVSVAALTLAGCTAQDTGSITGDSPSRKATSGTSAPHPPPGFKACLLRTPGGYADKAFSHASEDGLHRAGSELGVRVLAVDAEAAYSDELDALAGRGCDIITTVTFLLAGATREAARSHPELDFAIVDVAEDRPPVNLKGLLFESAEPSFLAGYLAAGVTGTRVIGTFGGAQIPTVTVYMDGFHAGIERYDEDNGTKTQLLGWDRETQKGTFTNDLASRTKGHSVAAEMIMSGADIIFPVAGAAGLGALRAVREAKVRAIWAETDGCVSAARYCDVLLTSVLKGMDVAVFQSIRDSAAGSFDNTPFVGTLANGGVGLAPYREQGGAVPADLDARIRELEQQIIDGDLEID